LDGLKRGPVLLGSIPPSSNQENENENEEEEERWLEVARESIEQR